MADVVLRALVLDPGVAERRVVRDVDVLGGAVVLAGAVQAVVHAHAAVGVGEILEVGRTGQEGAFGLAPGLTIASAQDEKPRISRRKSCSCWGFFQSA